MQKKCTLISLAILLGVWLMASCSGTRVDGIADSLGDKSPSWEGYDGSDDYFYWDMVFGQNMYAGTAELVEDDGHWYMQYTLFPEYLAEGWKFLDAHVEIANSAFNPKDGVPGKFTYKWDWEGDPDEMQDTVMLLLATYDKKTGDVVEYWAPPADGSDFYLAIHCTIGIWGITGYDEYGEPIYGLVENETGWGGYWNPKGKEGAYWDGNWKKWGGWIYTGSTMRFPDCKLPEDPVKYYTVYPGYTGPSYWDCTFDNQTPAFPTPWSDYTVSPAGDTWVGWCVDHRTSGYTNTQTVQLYCCYDPDLPEYLKSNNWDLISYILTQRNKGYYDTLVPGWDFRDIQDSIWYFKFAGTVPPAFTGHAAHRDIIIADAKINGEGFVPGSGEYYAVICHDLTGNQTNIIEVDP